MAEGLFEAVDPKLNMYALANGMDLVKESPGERRLVWYRDGRERGILIVGAGADRLSVVAAAWRSKAYDEKETLPVHTDLEPVDLAKRMSAILDPVVERANEL